MQFVKRAGSALLVAASLAASSLASPAVAGTVTIIQPFTLSSGGSGGALAGTQFGFQAFDPALGTLDSVSVLLEFDQLRFQVFRELGVETVPVIDLRVTNSGSGFETTGPGERARFPEVGPPTGLGSWKDVAGAYGLSFGFDATTDAAGQVLPSVVNPIDVQMFLAPITGTRSMFLNFSTVNLFFFAGNDFRYQDLTGFGRLVVWYNYSPNGGGTPVPEPGTLALLLAGLAVLAARALPHLRIPLNS